MSFELIDLGTSRSVPEDDALRRLARRGADVTVIIGGDAPARAHALRSADLSAGRTVIVELETECLGFHFSERSTGDTNVLGFARFRFGALPPSPLVELVRQGTTSAAALATAKTVFQGAGLDVSVCGDIPGRIVDALLRPYLNSALKGVDEGLASPSDMDRVLRLGLGHPKGPIEMLEQGGLVEHCQVCLDLHESLGGAEFLPARRARVASLRKRAGLDQGPIR